MRSLSLVLLLMTLVTVSGCLNNPFRPHLPPPQAQSDAVRG